MSAELILYMILTPLYIDEITGIFEGSIPKHESQENGKPIPGEGRTIMGPFNKVYIHRQFNCAPRYSGT
jgi:hypothetical protein